MKKATFVIAVLLVVAAGSPVAAAQNNSSNSTSTATATTTEQGPAAEQTQNQSETPSQTQTETPSGKTVDGVSYDRRIDNTTYVTDWRVSNGTLYIDLYAQIPTRVQVTETNDVEGASYVAISKQNIPPGHHTMTVDLQRPDDYMVLVYTRQSINNNRALKIAEKPGSIIGGPWDKHDVRNGAIGGALGVVLAVLYEAVSAKIGASERGERVA